MNLTDDDLYLLGELYDFDQTPSGVMIDVNDQFQSENVSGKYSRTEKAICALIENGLASFEVREFADEIEDGMTYRTTRNSEPVEFSLIQKRWNSIYFWWGHADENAWEFLGIYRPGNYSLYIALTQEGRRYAEEVFGIRRASEDT